MEKHTNVMIIVCIVSDMDALIHPPSDSTPHITSPIVGPPVMLSLTPHTLILVPSFTPATSMGHHLNTTVEKTFNTRSRSNPSSDLDSDTTVRS